MVAAVVAGVFLVGMVAQAATTITTNIQTDGTLSVTGLSSFTNASSTLLSTSGNFMVNGFATTTASNGNFATAGTVSVGATANAITDMSVGFCTIPTTTVTASSTNYADCTTNVTISTSDRVFVQATGSLPVNFVIEAASTTAATTINVRILNTGMIAGTLTGINSFNFWAAR